MKYQRNNHLLDALRGRAVYEGWLTWFGGEIHLRFEPAAFKHDLKRIERLIGEDRFVEAKRAIEESYRRWGSDPELIRLDTFHDYMTEPG